METKPNTIFRAEAVGALSTHQQLSHTLDVIPLKTKWLVAVIGVLMTLLITWLFCGHLDRTVVGRAIMMAGKVYIYVPVQYTNELSKGMEFRFSPVMANKARYGFMSGHLTAVSEYPVEEHQVLETIKSPGLVKSLIGDEVLLELDGILRVNPSTYSGYYWSVGKGPHFKLADGTLAEVQIIVEKLRPIEVLFPFLNRYFD